MYCAYNVLVRLEISLNFTSRNRSGNDTKMDDGEDGNASSGSSGSESSGSESDSDAGPPRKKHKLSFSTGSFRIRTDNSPPVTITMLQEWTAIKFQQASLDLQITEMLTKKMAQSKTFEELSQVFELQVRHRKCSIPTSPAADSLPAENLPVTAVNAGTGEGGTAE